jgi:crotonobetainyl-CoA:carnitine CoA-transferase CaiB-like acyl-CoA transferase
MTIQGENEVRGGPLAGVRVIEVGNETAEYCGLLLMGLGAEVIKVEPPEGSPSRGIGPFEQDREGDRESSLYFWHYNRGKKSVIVDSTTSGGRDALLNLVSSADILLRTVTPSTIEFCGLAPDVLGERYPELIDARLSPFGETGPWADFKGSDLVHLALGGVMSNCGYDREPGDGYDLPPIAPAMWHSHHIAGEQLAMGILAALLHRLHSGVGQSVSCAIHESVAKNTEIDVMNWVMSRTPTFRQTCRHASEAPNNVPTIANTKDGRWIMAMALGDRDISNSFEFAKRYGFDEDSDPGVIGEVAAGRNVPGTGTPTARGRAATELSHRLIRGFSYGRVPWRDAQAAGLLWAPLRLPEENLEDEHWRERGTFAKIQQPGSETSVSYPVSKWVSDTSPWSVGSWAPRLGEHTKGILQASSSARRQLPVPVVTPKQSGGLSRHRKPFAIEDVKILDFSWFLASAGGTRFANGFGAQSIKVEWSTHPDTRLAAMAPIGGREARRAATAPLPVVSDPNMGGQFNNKNPGKLGLALNVRHPRGLEIAKELVRVCDVVAEGFSPGVLDKWGLSYEEMKALNPRIIYVQQSGMGRKGTYGKFRTLGPIAASLSGLSEMSGLPSPAMPVGWGYSYLDWMGAYTFAQAILVALYHRDLTGEGQYIDSSQLESGLFVTGTALLDWQINERSYHRTGNRSPYKVAAPSGAFAARGDDRWLTISCHTEEEWRALTVVAEHPEWLSDQKIATLDARRANENYLESILARWVSDQDASTLMAALQAAGVPAGLCQTAQDRCDFDPQLAHLDWLTEVTGEKIGTWPVADFAVKLSRTPGFIGGRLDRGAPTYGQDTAQVLREYLGMTDADIDVLHADGVVG